MPADTYTQKLVDQAPSQGRLRTLRAPGEALLFRRLVIGVLTLCVLTPICLIVYQSFLDGPFFSANAQLGLS
ncbi:hypothetical protein, partial [Ochrobactrum sp. SFR4]|uniref:hypothetical protein n=1 Tax=Ochrobactrum sp. SFR4 TaxID=2717368 RepID=UPI001C8B4B56